MNAGINILCYKSKTLSNGEHPLMIRVCKDGKKKYLSLGISVLPQFWDFEKSKPKRNCPNKVQIEKIIAEKSQQYAQQIIEFKTDNKPFTATSLIKSVNKPVIARTVGELFLAQIKQLKAEKRTGYAMSHLEVYNSLVRFNGHLDIYFSDIDINWLKRYETWLRSNGSAENTIGKRFRTLRAAFNLAIEQNIVKAEYYPFKAYKVSKLHKATAKRSISKGEINAVVGYDYNGRDKYIPLAIDLFAFSYYTGGINFVDMAYMTSDNLVDGKLIYTRKKTGKLIRLPLQPKAIEIIERYQKSGSKYIFPILSDFHKTEQSQRNRIHKVITNVNKRLKEIGKELNIPIALTTYVARHSYATVLKRAGVSTSIICESLGHSSEKVTQIYLDSFENSQIDEAMQHLL
ncbi:site-specific integrase [Bacteroidales bacterium OttesenSCG-928-B11]|nr:site-specific integrase [Bacteroidales bacterium OttesenSCG-928-E04]MDL2312631.1 site-specific integrase [Bacteroidales bacterium OttesenSCG-928-B11]